MNQSSCNRWSLQPEPVQLYEASDCASVDKLEWFKPKAKKNSRRKQKAEVQSQSGPSGSTKWNEAYSSDLHYSTASWPRMSSQLRSEDRWLDALAKQPICLRLQQLLPLWLFTLGATGGASWRLQLCSSSLGCDGWWSFSWLHKAVDAEQGGFHWGIVNGKHWSSRTEI